MKAVRNLVSKLCVAGFALVVNPLVCIAAIVPTSQSNSVLDERNTEILPFYSYSKSDPWDNEASLTTEVTDTSINFSASLVSKNSYIGTWFELEFSTTSYSMFDFMAIYDGDDSWHTPFVGATLKRSSDSATVASYDWLALDLHNLDTNQKYFFDPEWKHGRAVTTNNYPFYLAAGDYRLSINSAADSAYNPHNSPDRVVLDISIDVTPVPVPATIWLFASGLMYLSGFFWRKRISRKL